MEKLFLSTLFVSTMAFGGETPKVHSNARTASKSTIDPCAKLESDCSEHGYVFGESPQGKGLWYDCMCPLIAPGFPEPSNNALKVPSDPELARSCVDHPRGKELLDYCAKLLAKWKADSHH